MLIQRTYVILRKVCFLEMIIEERIDDNFILREYGFEKAVNFSKG
ncbi:hypothetical protein CLO_1009 [Clostridium botulinum E1 str. 'BoNT E Beluga']|nr:hypothetical protein CLO_1009 [Clostridium botulinum E1 str. 'BoNT E Beluga']